MKDIWKKLNEEETRELLGELASHLAYGAFIAKFLLKKQGIVFNSLIFDEDFQKFMSDLLEDAEKKNEINSNAFKDRKSLTFEAYRNALPKECPEYHLENKEVMDKIKNIIYPCYDY